MYDIDAFTRSSTCRVCHPGCRRLREVRLFIRAGVRADHDALSLTFDHRLVDGAPPLAFCSGLRALSRTLFAAGIGWRYLACCRSLLGVSMGDCSADIAVVGAGPGLCRCLRALSSGKGCVRRSDSGGVCLNWGCIPTKACCAPRGSHSGSRGSRLRCGGPGASLDWPRRRNARMPSS